MELYQCYVFNTEQQHQAFHSCFDWNWIY